MKRNGDIIHSDENPAPCNLVTKSSTMNKKKPCEQHLLHSFDEDAKTCAFSSSFSCSDKGDEGDPSAPTAPYCASLSVFGGSPNIVGSLSIAVCCTSANAW